MFYLEGLLNHVRYCILRFGFLYAGTYVVYGLQLTMLSYQQFGPAHFVVSCLSIW
jgi:hypothetical protein